MKLLKIIAISLAFQASAVLFNHWLFDHVFDGLCIEWARLDAFSYLSGIVGGLYIYHATPFLHDGKRKRLLD